MKEPVLSSRMATTIEVVDGTAFQEAIASVRNDATDDKFVICGHADGDPNRIQVRMPVTA